MSGVWTGMARVTIAGHPGAIPSALVPVPTASAGAAVGAITPGTAGQRIAAGTLRRARSAAWASAPRG